MEQVMKSGRIMVGLCGFMILFLMFIGTVQLVNHRLSSAIISYIFAIVNVYNMKKLYTSHKYLINKYKNTLR